MGVCHSGCRAPPPELEYYDAWRHSAPRVARKRLKERVTTSKRTARSSRCCALKQRAVDAPPVSSKLWVCAHGCCSIRWKLDYAGLISYKAYADMSPYVVTVDAAGLCRCVICEGFLPVQLNRRQGLAMRSALSKGERAGAPSGKASVSSGESLTDDEDLLL